MKRDQANNIGLVSNSENNMLVIDKNEAGSAQLSHP